MKQVLPLFFLFVLGCSSSKKFIDNPLPGCLQNKIDALTKEHNTPQSVTRYAYKGAYVYYMLSACCDQFNIVFDSECRILGYPDGGFTGRGNGTLPDFRDSSANSVVVWKRN